MSDQTFNRAVDALKSACGAASVMAVRFDTIQGHVQLDIASRLEDDELLEIAAHALLCEAADRLDEGCDGCRARATALRQAADLLYPAGFRKTAPGPLH